MIKMSTVIFSLISKVSDQGILLKIIIEAKLVFLTIIASK